MSQNQCLRVSPPHDLITGPNFIVMKAAGEFRDKTPAPNQLWQTGFAYLKVIGWVWFCLSTVLDGYGWHIINWKPCTGMAASDLQDKLNQAREDTGLDQANVIHRSRPQSGNKTCYISGEFANVLVAASRSHVAQLIIRKPKTRSRVGIKGQRTASCWKTASCPVILKRKIAGFVGHYTHQHYYESLHNPTPTDDCSGCGHTILLELKKKEASNETKALAAR